MQEWDEEDVARSNRTVAELLEEDDADPTTPDARDAPEPLPLLSEDADPTVEGGGDGR